MWCKDTCYKGFKFSVLIVIRATSLTGSGNGSSSRQPRPARRLGQRQCVQHCVCVGPQFGLQEECRQGRRQGQGLRAGAGRCASEQQISCLLIILIFHRLSVQSVVKLMRGVLQCIMRQVGRRRTRSSIHVILSTSYNETFTPCLHPPPTAG